MQIGLNTPESARLSTSGTVIALHLRHIHITQKQMPQKPTGRKKPAAHISSDKKLQGEAPRFAFQSRQKLDLREVLENADGNLIRAAIIDIAEAGGLLSFGMTSTRTALTITLIHDDLNEPYRQYAGTPEGVNEALSNLLTH